MPKFLETNNGSAPTASEEAVSPKTNPRTPPGSTGGGGRLGGRRKFSTLSQGYGKTLKEVLSSIDQLSDVKFLEFEDGKYDTVIAYRQVDGVTAYTAIAVLQSFQSALTPVTATRIGSGDRETVEVVTTPSDYFIQLEVVDAIDSFVRTQLGIASSDKTVHQTPGMLLSQDMVDLNLVWENQSGDKIISGKYLKEVTTFAMMVFEVLYNALAVAFDELETEACFTSAFENGNLYQVSYRGQNDFVDALNQPRRADSLVTVAEVENTRRGTDNNPNLQQQNWLTQSAPEWGTVASYLTYIVEDEQFEQWMRNSGRRIDNEELKTIQPMVVVNGVTSGLENEASPTHWLAMFIFNMICQFSQSNWRHMATNAGQSFGREGLKLRDPLVLASHIADVNGENWLTEMEYFQQEPIDFASPVLTKEDIYKFMSKYMREIPIYAVRHTHHSADSWITEYLYASATCKPNEGMDAVVRTWLDMVIGRPLNLPTDRNVFEVAGGYSFSGTWKDADGSKRDLADFDLVGLMNVVAAHNDVFNHEVSNDVLTALIMTEYNGELDIEAMADIQAIINRGTNNTAQYTSRTSQYLVMNGDVVDAIIEEVNSLSFDEDVEKDEHGRPLRGQRTYSARLLQLIQEIGWHNCDVKADSRQRVSGGRFVNGRSSGRFNQVGNIRNGGTRSINARSGFRFTR